MKKNLILSFILALVSSCSTLSFWSDDSEEDISEPVPLKEFNEEFKISVKWKKSFKGQNNFGTFKPAFYQGQIFFASSEGEIVSINPDDGVPNWKLNLDRELASGVTAGFGKLVASDNNGNVIAIDLETQNILWEKNIGGEILSNAVIDAARVIAKNSAGELIALNSKSGEVDWSFRSQLPSLTVRGTGEPVIANETVISTFDNGRLAVFQLDTGFFLWDAPISFIEGSSELENLIDADSAPLVIQQLVFATNYQGNLTAFDLAQKRPVWNAEASSFHSPLIANNLILVFQDDGSILSFSLSSLAPSWTSSEYLRREVSNGAELNNMVFIGDLDGYVHIINPLTGKTVGRKKISGTKIQSIISFGGLVYAIDQDANLFAINI